MSRSPSSLRVLGIDPGLTRCGIGVVDIAPGRTVTFVSVEVIRTAATMPLEERVLAIALGIERIMDEQRPDAVAIERVFAQQNLHSVMGVAQASGVALRAAAARGLAVGFHTPTQVKAALTGYGAAEKKQLATMVARVLRLDTPPTPADASDALAIAICHGWHTGGAAAESGALTPAQQAWRAAERSAGTSSVPRRLAP